MWQSITDPVKWNHLLSGFAAPHVLQTWEWGEFKSHWGWTPQRWLLADAAGEPRAMMQVLRRSAGRLPFCVLYCPKGPTVNSPAAYAEALAWLEQAGRRERAIWVKCDGDVHAGGTITLDDARQTLRTHGWHQSLDQVQFRNTVLSDLRHSDAELLAGMKQKWRYNIRLAEKRGVTLRQLAP
ncbi:MAG TPA: peptidoglycan bridge formation glycyltransferase FemA/FemB family protein, partial [Anaerolineae bacterium]